MRWQGRRQSENVEDRRGMTPGGMAVGGGLGTVVLVLIVSLLMGKNPLELMSQMEGSGDGTTSSGQYVPTEEEKQLEEFVRVTLADTEDVWTQQFQAIGREYVKPTLVLYKDRVQTGGGMASAAMGPFYLDTDEKVYIDLGFYQVLRDQLGARGDFAQAYVIAHEVGHHIQHLLGTLDQVHEQRQRLSETQYNHLSVRLELQADFYAGVWAHYEQKMFGTLDPDDIQEAMEAAQAIGDDKLQRESQGRVVPDSFTHGTSEQRMRWFMKGWKTGDIRQGDTFRIPESEL
ncbi:MAG: neutral zinc metallopeptidase [Fimbriimonadales bacterium]